MLIGDRSYVTIMKELSEPLNSFIIVIYDIRPTYSFPLLFHDCAFGNGRIITSRIFLTIHLIATTNIDKLYDSVGQKFKFLCKLIGCEAQEGVE